MCRGMLILIAVLALAAPPLGGQEAAAPGPHPDSLAALDGTPLAPGARIRMRGAAVDELARPTGRDILVDGLAGAYLFRNAAEGAVLFADRDSLVFTDLKRGGVISLEWDRLDSIEVYRGRSVGRGALEGALLGVLSGAVTWGIMEIVFSGDLWDVDGAMIMAASTAGGTLGGALSRGDRWEPVRPPRR